MLVYIAVSETNVKSRAVEWIVPVLYPYEHGSTSSGKGYSVSLRLIRRYKFNFNSEDMKQINKYRCRFRGDRQRSAHAHECRKCRHHVASGVPPQRRQLI